MVLFSKYINQLATAQFICHTGHSTRSSARVTTGTRLAAAIAAEKLDEFGDLVGPHRQHPVQPRKSRATAKRKRTATDDAGTDADDNNFSASSSDDGSDNDGDIDIISNEEV
jgi:hypothetical protein